MEFTELDELNTIVQQSQTYHQAGLNDMIKQLQNTPKHSNMQINNPNFTTLSNKATQNSNNNLRSTQTSSNSTGIQKQLSSGNDQKLMKKESSMNPQTSKILALLDPELQDKDENLDELMDDLNQIIEEQGNNSDQQGIQKKNNLEVPQKSSSQGQKNIKKSPSDKNNKELEQEIVQIIKTYQKNIIPSDNDDSDSSESKSNQDNQVSNNKQENQNKIDIEEQEEKEQQISQTLFEKQQLDKVQTLNTKKSLFTENMNKGVTQNVNQQQKALFMTQKKNPNMKQITVFFFAKPDFKITVNVLKTIKVKELIRIIIDQFLADEKCDSKQMRYPEHIKAYELRILDDDDYYIPDMSFPPIDHERIIQRIEFDQIAFIENGDFRPPPKKKEEIHPNLEKIMQSVNKNNLILKIDVQTDSKENFTTMIPISSDQLLKDIFNPLQRKNPKITSKQYIIMKKDEQGNLEEMDPEMPIIYLNTNLITLKKRNFADMPEEDQGISQSFVSELIQEQLSTYQAQGLRQEIQQNKAPLNLVKACKYQEFDVIKINERGKRQERILGINQFKILNINSKLQNQNMGLLNQLFSNKLTGTKKAERLIEDIESIEILKPCVFGMKVRNDQTSGDKFITYETKNQQTAEEIVEKVKFLIKIKGN